MLKFLRLLALSLALLALSGSMEQAAAEKLEGEALIEALRRGGFRIYFRHAATDWGQADRVREAGDWKSCDPKKMRQLSHAGRESARRIGEAIVALAIPIGRIRSSEYCRAAETARLFGLGPVETTSDIMNMRATRFLGGDEAVIGRLQRILAEPTSPGKNEVLVGHGNLMRAATGAYTGEAGSGIYRPRPESEGGFALVAELSPEDWTALAERFGRD